MIMRLFGSAADVGYRHHWLEPRVIERGFPGFSEMLHQLRSVELSRMPRSSGPLLSAGAAGTWYFEWIADVLGLACCCVISWYAAQAAWSSYSSGAVNIKTLVTPEWWALAPLPVAFVLLSIEMVFRMIRLADGERGPRRDAVSAA